MHESFKKYLESRLEQWADWHLHGNHYGIGYPPCALEYRLLHEGHIDRQSGQRPLLSNAEAEEIEDLVKQLADYNPLLAKVLRYQYLTVGTLRSRAAHFKMSHVHFKHCVDMAQQWLAGRLSAKKKYRHK